MEVSQFDSAAFIGFFLHFSHAGLAHWAVRVAPVALTRLSDAPEAMRMFLDPEGKFTKWFFIITAVVLLAMMIMGPPKGGSGPYAGDSESSWFRR